MFLKTCSTVNSFQLLLLRQMCNRIVRDFDVILCLCDCHVLKIIEWANMYMEYIFCSKTSGNFPNNCFTRLTLASRTGSNNGNLKSIMPLTIRLYVYTLVAFSNPCLRLKLTLNIKHIADESRFCIIFEHIGTIFWFWNYMP